MKIEVHYYKNKGVTLGKNSNVQRIKEKSNLRPLRTLFLLTLIECGNTAEKLLVER